MSGYATMTRNPQLCIMSAVPIIIYPAQRLALCVEPRSGEAQEREVRRYFITICCGNANTFESLRLRLAGWHFLRVRSLR